MDLEEAFRNAYTTNNQKGTVAIIDDKYIKLPKIGKVKAVFIAFQVAIGLLSLLLIFGI